MIPAAPADAVAAAKPAAAAGVAVSVDPGGSAAAHCVAAGLAAAHQVPVRPVDGGSAAGQQASSVLL